MSRKFANAGFKLADRKIRKHLKDGKTDDIKDIIKEMEKDFFSFKTNDPLLCAAAKMGNQEVVEALIGKGACITAKDHHGQAALHIAAKEGHVDIVKLLLKEGTPVQLLTDGNDSALYIAVKHNQDKVVSTLIQNGADIHHQSSFINSKDLPLHAAAALSCSTVLNLLLETSADIDAQNEDRRTALHVAAVKGCHWNVKRLLKCGANPNVLDSGGQTPLLAAADSGNVEVIRQLCIAGAFLNVENDASETALRKAVGKRHINVVRTLLHFGADVNREFVDGQACLSFFISQCSHKMTKSWGGSGWHQLPKVHINVEVELLDILIAAGADLEHVDSQGHSCLHVCVRSGCAPVLDYLINNGANCLLVNKAGQTVLQYACVHNTTPAIQLLTQNCASLVNHASNSGFLNTLQDESSFTKQVDPSSPLCVLWQKRNRECLQLLCEAGYRSTTQERTFLELAARPDKKKVDGVIANHLRHEFSNPWSLLRIARTVIRDQLKVGIERKANKLPIPVQLQDSVCLKNILL